MYRVRFPIHPLGGNADNKSIKIKTYGGSNNVCRWKQCSVNGSSRNGQSI